MPRRIITLLVLLTMLSAFIPISPTDYAQANFQTCDEDTDYVDLIFDSLDEGEYEAAIIAGNCAVELYPDDAYSYFFRGIVFFELGYYNETVEDIEVALDIGIDDDEALFEALSIFGDSLLYLGDSQTAIEVFDFMLEVAPDDEPLDFVYSGRAYAYLDAGNYDSAIDDFTTVIDEYIDPEDTEALGFAYLDLSSAQLLDGDFDTGVENLVLASENLPVEYQWLIPVVLADYYYYVEDDFGIANDVILSSLEDLPDVSNKYNARYYLVSLAFEAEAFDVAIDSLRTIINGMPSYSEEDFPLGDYDQFRIEPSFDLAEIYFYQDELDLAIDTYINLIESGIDVGSEGDAFQGLADVYSYNLEDDIALETSQIAVELLEEAGDFDLANRSRLTVGLSQFYLGESDAAITTFEDVIASDFTDPYDLASAYVYLADVYFFDGSDEDTVEQLDFAISLLQELAAYDDSYYIDDQLLNAYIRRGEAHFYLDEDELALEDYEAAYQFAEAETEVLAQIAFYLGIINYFLDDLELSEDYLNEAIDLYLDLEIYDTFLGDAFNIRGQLSLIEGDLDTAINDLTNALEYGTVEPYLAYLFRAIAYEELGEYDLAADDYETIYDLEVEDYPVEEFIEEFSDIFLFPECYEVDAFDRSCYLEAISAFNNDFTTTFGKPDPQRGRRSTLRRGSISRGASVLTRSSRPKRVSVASNSGFSSRITIRGSRSASRRS